MFDAESYGISIAKVIEDGERLFRARVAELPDVECFEGSAAEAYAAAIEVIMTLFEMAKEQGAEFPSPSQSAPEYSGRVTLRLPRSVHRDIDQAAKAENVSLNTFLVGVISEAIGNKKAVAIPNVTREVTHSGAAQYLTFSDWALVGGVTSGSTFAFDGARGVAAATIVAGYDEIIAESPPLSLVWERERRNAR